jgi:hypothetical protein
MEEEIFDFAIVLGVLLPDHSEMRLALHKLCVDLSAVLLFQFSVAMWENVQCLSNVVCIVRERYA